MEELKIDENDSTEHKPQNARKWPQYLAALVANLGALSIGSLLGWTSQAGPKLENGETGVQFTTNELSWLAGLMPLGAAFAAIPIPFLIGTLGRKNTLLAVVIPCVAGFALLAWADNVEMYYAGRFVTGMIGGAFSIVVPVYTAEISEKHIRGALGNYFDFMLAIGTEFSYVVGGSVSVFWLSIICGMVPIVFGIIFIFMPESPYFYIAKNKPEKAEKALKWLRGKNYDISWEMKEITESIEQTRNEKLSLAHFKTKAAVKSIIIAFWLMVFQEFGGANAVVFNTTSIFQAAGSDLDPESATMIVGAIQFIGNILSVLLVDRLGRKFLLISSGFVMGVCTLILGVYFHLQDTGQNVDSIKWLPLISLCFYLIMFSAGWGPVPWMMLGELFPTKIKGIASSFASATNWIGAFLVTKFFPELSLVFGRDVTFWIFTVISAIGIFFVYFGVPETKGKTLEEIQKDLSGVQNKAFNGEAIQ